MRLVSKRKRAEETETEKERKKKKIGEQQTISLFYNLLYRISTLQPRTNLLLGNEKRAEIPYLFASGRLGSAPLCNI